MHLVSRALAWVRGVFFGAPDYARTTLPAAPQSVPDGHAHHPSPEIWAALLTSARRRRAPHLWPPSPLPTITAADITSRLVGLYLLPPEVHQRARAAARLAEEARP